MAITAWLLLAVAVFLAYANGANDNFKAAATVYGSRTLSYRKALIWATTAQVIGSAAALFWATALVKQFSGKGLVPDAITVHPPFLVAVGLGAALAVILATRVGLPISTTHALTGALVGAGLLFSDSGVQLAMLGSKFFLPLMISPILAFAATMFIYPIASAARKAMRVDAQTCLCIGPTPQPVLVNHEGLMVTANSGSVLAVDQIEHCRQLYTGSIVGVSAKSLVDAGHLLSSFALGFARGLNDTPKIMGVLFAAQISLISQPTALVILASVMAIGGLIQSRRLARTLGDRITTMNRGQGMTANLVASTLVIGASAMGMPVSTTHVSCGSIFGIGLAKRQADWKLITGILAAWVGTLPLAAALSAITAALFIWLG